MRKGPILPSDLNLCTVNLKERGRTILNQSPDQGDGEGTYVYVFYVFVFFCFLFVVCDAMPYNVHYGQLMLNVCVKSQWSN